MIKLLQSTAGISVPPGSIGTKIAADLLAYGTGYSFLTAWQQLSPQGQQTALLCKKENALLLSVAAGADLQELAAFVQAVGGQFLQMQGPQLPKLPFSSTRPFCECCLQPGPQKEPAPAGLITRQASLKACYQILYCESCADLAPVEFTGWYADLSHKIRHDAAFCAVLNGAAAVVSHLYGSTAVLSGVAVQKSLRGNGRGRQLLAALPALLPGVQQFYVGCSAQAKPFYKACGFLPSGQTIITGRL